MLNYKEKLLIYAYNPKIHIKKKRKEKKKENEMEFIQ